MKESFEIPVEGCDLSEVRQGDIVTYQAKSDDGTVVSVTTTDAVSVDEITCSKYRNARIKIIIDIDHDDVEYKGVTP